MHPMWKRKCSREYHINIDSIQCTIFTRITNKWQWRYSVKKMRAHANQNGNDDNYMEYCEKKQKQNFKKKKNCWITNWLPLVKSKNFQFCCDHFWKFIYFYFFWCLALNVWYESYYSFSWCANNWAVCWLVYL